MVKRITAIVLILVMALVGALSCSEQQNTAVLHQPDDRGYIPVSSFPLELEILSGQAFAYDTEEKTFLFVKGEEKVLYPASTTKLLTILYALTLLPQDLLVTPGDELELVAENSSIAYIKSHHVLSVEMLVEGMLLPSGNDAAYVLAAAAGRTLLGKPDAGGKEAVDAFMEGMNNYAREIGCCGSRFVSPDGNSEEVHYSTVEDMALIARLAAENECIMRYAGLASDEVEYASGEYNTWQNSNLLVCPDSEYYTPCVSGLKTGSLGKGKYSVIATATIDGKLYIIGVFSSDNKRDRFEDVWTIISKIEQG